MSTPVDALMAGVAWELVPEPTEAPGDLPHVTHRGALTLFGHLMRVYRISTGQAIINADDLEAFFADALADSEGGDHD